MPDPLTLSSPTRRFSQAETDALESFARPLTKKDYYRARVSPKDGKHTDDLFFGGFTFLCRHAGRNWHRKRRSMAAFQFSLLPLSVAALLANVALIDIPAFALFFGQRLFYKPRSEDATRENVIGRALYQYAFAVNCFAGSRQYHEGSGEPYSPTELQRLHERISTVSRELEEKQQHSAARIRESKTLNGTMTYLNRMNDSFKRRIIDGHWF